MNIQGMRIVELRLNVYEDEFGHAGSQVTVQWSHSAPNAAKVLGMCGGGELAPSSMLGADSFEQRAMKTVRTFRFEDLDDAIEVYERFRENLRAQEKRERPARFHDD